MAPASPTSEKLTKFAIGKLKKTKKTREEFSMSLSSSSKKLDRWFSFKEWVKGFDKKLERESLIVRIMVDKGQVLEKNLSQKHQFWMPCNSYDLLGQKFGK